MKHQALFTAYGLLGGYKHDVSRQLVRSVESSLDLAQGR